jgi:general secretion pathway protein D
MKLLGALAACVLAGLPLAASAQESSRSSASAGIDMSELLAKFSKRTGKSIIIDPRVRATVPLAGIDPAQITYDQLLAILDVHQFVMVESGGVFIVVPDANARNLPSPVFTDVRFQAPDHALVTLLLTPKKTCAVTFVPVLRPLMPQAAHMAADVGTNTLIINDRAINVRRIAELVAEIDKRGDGNKDCSTTYVTTPPAKKPD